MIKLLAISAIILIIPLDLLSQGDIDEQQRIFYRNERTAAILLNSNGFGASYREGKRIDFLNKRIIDIDLNIIKHPREVKLVNPYFISSSSFIYGKLNNTITLRAAIGNQHELYKKIDLGGVAIRYFYSGGPIIAVSKPIYYNILYPTFGGDFELKEEKFTETIQPSDIYSRASFFKGFNEIGVIPGIFVKGGFNFEYSKEDKVIHAIELGASFEAFPKRVPIMASQDNKALFFTMFVSYRLGVVIDPLNPGSTKLPTLFFRK
jgi:hypothetical protein